MYNSFSCDYTAHFTIEFISIVVLFCVRRCLLFKRSHVWYVLLRRWNSNNTLLLRRLCCVTHRCRSGLCNSVRGVVHCGKILLLSRAGRSLLSHVTTTVVLAVEEDLQFELFNPYISYKLCGNKRGKFEATLNKLPVFN